MNSGKEQWEQEVLSSLKKQEMPPFSKQVVTGCGVFPFSKKTIEQGFQSPTRRASFLTIQNYEDLKKSNMDEWMNHEKVGFRFRQFNDLLNYKLPENKTLFLSQPFSFSLDSQQKEKVLELEKNGNHLHLGWSPLSFGLTRGEILKRPFKDWDRIFSEESLHNSCLTWFYLSSAPYQWAGAEAHMELGVLLSLAFSILQEMNSLGVPDEVVFKKFSFGLALGTDILVESSKMAALRVLWQKLYESLTEKRDLSPIEIYGLPSLRSFSGRDTLNNLLRTSTMALSAILGGGNGFKCIPYDALNKNKSKEALRVSTNIPLLLTEEAFVAQADDALNGASLFDETTKLICEKAWMFFQEIEKKGGLFESVRSGWLQMELKRNEEFSKNQLCYFQKELVGVNRYVVRQVETGVVEPQSILKLSDMIDPLFLNKSDDEFLTVEPLLVHSLCYEWDVVQAKSDSFFQKKGIRPRVLIIKGGGPVVEKKLSWLQQLLSVGGMQGDVVSAESTVALAEDAPLIVLIPSQDEMEESLLTKLRPLSRAKIWSMNSSKNLSTMDKFLQMDVNALDVIKEVQSLLLGDL